MEEEVISLSELFTFKYRGETASGAIKGDFEAHATRPRFLPRLEQFGLAEAFMKTLGVQRIAA